MRIHFSSLCLMYIKWPAVVHRQGPGTPPVSPHQNFILVDDCLLISYHVARSGAPARTGNTASIAMLVYFYTFCWCGAPAKSETPHMSVCILCLMFYIQLPDVVHRPSREHRTVYRLKHFRDANMCLSVVHRPSREHRTMRCMVYTF